MFIVIALSIVSSIYIVYAHNTLREIFEGVDSASIGGFIGILPGLLFLLFFYFAYDHQKTNPQLRQVGDQEKVPEPSEAKVESSISKLEPTVDNTSPEKMKLGDKRQEIINKYMESFEISEPRANSLYDAGYKRFEDYNDAIVEDLIMVEKINPTVARKIISKLTSEKNP